MRNLTLTLIRDDIANIALQERVISLCSTGEYAYTFRTIEDSGGGRPILDVSIENTHKEPLRFRAEGVESIYSLLFLHEISLMNSEPLIIYISGGRAQIGKSTICLGILGTLLRLGYRTDEIAYIKPATQCRKEQLVTKYCRAMDISYCDIGPIVYYKGFTREFLKKETDSTQSLLQKVKDAVSSIGCGKRIVLVDGVGYPSVGSVCGLSNATIAHVLGAAVLLVLNSGVGDAIDSFNLNACYFESNGVTVLGAVFNRFSPQGYYSLESCRPSLEAYFKRFRPEKRVYGLVMAIDRLDEETQDKVTENSCSFESNDKRFVDQIVDLIATSVDVSQILQDAERMKRKAEDSAVKFAPDRVLKQLDCVGDSGHGQ